MTLTVVAGKEQVELSALDLTLRVVDPAAAVAGLTELAREPGPRLERVGVGSDVDRLREAGMRDRAVVALEVVLDADLPVRVVLDLDTVAEDERVDVEPAAGDQPGSSPRCSVSGGASRSGLTNTNGPQVSTWSGTSPSPSRRKPGSPVRPRSAPQRAVELVGPRVVSALQCLPPALALAEDRAAMTADVDERAQHTLAVADEDDRNVSHARRGVRPRLGNLPCVARVLPEPAEDPVLLEAQDAPGPCTSSRGPSGCSPLWPCDDCIVAS